MAVSFNKYFLVRIKKNNCIRSLIFFNFTFAFTLFHSLLMEMTTYCLLVQDSGN